MKTYVVLFILFGTGILLSVYVKKLSWLSLGNFGVRKIKKWKTKTDTLANIFLFLTFVFCFAYWLSPYSFVVYSILLLFVTLITMVRVGVLPKKHIDYPCWVAFCFFMVGFTGWMSVLYSHETLPIVLFRKDVLQGTITSVLYFLQQENFAYTVLEGMIMWLPFWFLLNQFKTMRTEKYLRSRNTITCTIKVIFICFIMLYVSVNGFTFLDFVYQKPGRIPHLNSRL